jgi:putative transposase
MVIARLINEKNIECLYSSSNIVASDYNVETKDLKIRNYECPKCHNELERDLNASINIMFEGIKQYMKII